MELVTEIENDKGWMFSIPELAALGIESEAPPMVWSMLALGREVDVDGLVQFGAESFRARVESLDSEAVDQLRGAGEAVRTILGSASSAFRINVVDGESSMKMLVVRGGGDRMLVAVLQQLDWTVVGIGGDTLLASITDRALDSTLGFVLEEFGPDGVSDGFAWDGKSSIATPVEGSWVTEEGDATSARSGLRRFLSAA